MTIASTPLLDSAAEPERGISAALARARAARIGDIRYDVALSIPDALDSPIAAIASITFSLADAAAPVVLDFDPGASAEGRLAIDLNGRSIEAARVNGHVILPPSALRIGRNVVTISCTAGDAPLNRGDDFLYSIFVPARAHQALPCFDQPDLKARWRLSIDMPGRWEALGNAAETSRESHGGRTRVTFEETPPISTYLFAFAAGRLSIESRERAGRAFRIFHRDRVEDIAGSLETIADLQSASLEWLEQYTGVPYPFGKFDMLLVPAFQFGGMEHPGAIFYNAASLLLDDSATQTQQLDRAALIAHETAHIWFGDLVTMPWFDDVWVKEVFANMMAGKILASLLPGVNHDLRFLHAHYPPAYDIDRTEGTNAIRQPLANLNEAGALYGAIVYHKAPIVMQQLEMRLGADRFRAGLREYLRRYAFDAASWQDLLDVLDGIAPGGVSDWSRAWLNEMGRPIVETVVQVQNGGIDRLALIDTSRRHGHAWNQELRAALVYHDRVEFVPALLDREVVEVDAARGLPAPSAVLPNGGGVGYGDFRLDRASAEWLLQGVPTIGDALVRGAAWLALWDAMLGADVAPGRLIDLALRALARETDELNVQRVLACLQQTCWRFTSPRRRVAIAPRVERSLFDLLHLSHAATLKAGYFRTLREVSLSPSILEWMASIWRKEQTVPGVPLAERDDITLVQELSVRRVAGSDAMLATQIARTASADRRARLAFVSPALAADSQVRDRFFSSLGDRSNRRREAWVLEGLHYLHHPLRAEEATRYIRPSLELLREIQRTGDIFFPKRWVDATLWGHQSAAAADAVRAFLGDLPSGYPDRLRRVVLSSADLLFRAVKIVTPDGS